LKAGYRLIDTANDYGNEHMIGEALQELFSRGVVTRDQLFIQSKLWNANHRWEPVFFGGKLSYFISRIF
jgi:diketogulonate reductase-like aldo/keto reductase